MADDKRLVNGTMISSYRLTEQIGKGGFATVWSAWDTRLNRLVAIKLLSLEGEDELGMAQFEREAGMIAQLQHPFIVPLHDFGKTTEHRYLVMRYVIGGSLAQRLQQTPRLPIAETLRLIALIASALDYVHDQQIAHRDLKPANILLDAQGLPYLSDFGLAKSIHQRAAQHTIAGTLYYMSPEQYLGEQLSIQTDIYSLGILLYQLFAGGLPHGGNASHGALQLRSGAEERLPDITLLQPSLPPALNDLLWQMTAINPHERPTSAQSVAQRLATLFAAQGATIEQEALKLLQGVNTGSINYRRLEAERILERTLPVWQRGELPLSLTEFVLLHDYLQETPTLVNQAVGTLMLRSAFEYGQFIDAWWTTSDEYRRWLACDHAIASGGDAASRALGGLSRLIEANVHTTPPPSLVHLRQKMTEHVTERLMPPSALTAPALNLLELLLDRPITWPTPKLVISDDQTLVDTKLAEAATSALPIATQAAALIGLARRTEAVVLLANQPSAFEQLMQVREAAGSLPRTVPALPTSKQWQVSLKLGLRQVLRHPLTSFLQYDVAAAGCALGMAWLVYTVYPDVPAKTLNVIGLGLLFGAIIAFGLWSARHIASELRVLASGWRIGLAILVGGVIIAESFILFNQLVYDEVLDVELALASGAVFVAGTALNIRWSGWLQGLIGVVSIMLALLIPWAGYLRYYEGIESFAFPAAPFVFATETVIDAVPIVLVAAVLIMLGVVLGAKLFPYQISLKKSVPDAAETNPLPAALKSESITRVIPSEEVLKDVASVEAAPDQPHTRLVPPL